MSAALPVTGPSWRTWVCPTTAMSPSMWHPMSLYPKKQVLLCSYVKDTISLTSIKRKVESLHLNHISFFQYHLITCKWRKMANCVVYRNASRKGDSPFNLPLHILVHITSLLSDKCISLLTHINNLGL
uniref:EBP1 n=1 Tax=Rhizophora mucronata TaxID=61149 RepID=A0A2P2LUY3_RHIMU